MIRCMRAAPTSSGRKLLRSSPAGRMRVSIVAVVACLILAQLVSAVAGPAAWACRCQPLEPTAPLDACCRLEAPTADLARTPDIDPDCTACLALPDTDTAISQTWITPRPLPALVIVTPPILVTQAAWPTVIRIPDRGRRTHLPPPQFVRSLRSVILTC